MSPSLPVVDDIALAFATPRKLPKPARLGERVVVVDIAFAADGGGPSFEKTTGKFIEQLGDRLVAWVDHHDSLHHPRFAADRRFVLATKAEHGACPEMITPELVERYGRPDTIVCHVDFDGLASAAKWIRRGEQPYAGCDADARAVDTCTGEVSATGAQLDRALRARPRDAQLLELVVRHLVSGAVDSSSQQGIAAAAEQYAAIEQRTLALAAGYQPLGQALVVVDASGQLEPYDKTLLLVQGQRRAEMAAVVDGDTVTFAAAFDSGVDFLKRLGLSGGMPTRVSIRTSRLLEALGALGVPATVASQYAAGRRKTMIGEGDPP